MDKADYLLKHYLTQERALSELAQKVLDDVEKNTAPDVPLDLIHEAKGLIQEKGAKRNDLQCPHCRKAITPFKKSPAAQALGSYLWCFVALGSFLLSFAVPRFFLQFLALTLIFSIKFMIDQRALKTQVLIYKALKESDHSTSSRDLHRSASRL